MALLVMTDIIAAGTRDTDIVSLISVGALTKPLGAIEPTCTPLMTLLVGKSPDIPAF